MLRTLSWNQSQCRNAVFSYIQMILVDVQMDLCAARCWQRSRLTLLYKDFNSNKWLLIITHYSHDFLLRAGDDIQSNCPTPDGLCSHKQPSIWPPSPLSLSRTQPQVCSHYEISWTVMVTQGGSGGRRPLTMLSGFTPTFISVSFQALRGSAEWEW